MLPFGHLLIPIMSTQSEATLDFLREGIRDRFGSLGQWTVANLDLVQRTVDDYLLDNYSQSHSPLTDDEFVVELVQTKQVVDQITGGYALKPCSVLPYGDATSMEYLARAGYSIALL